MSNGLIHVLHDFADSAGQLTAKPMGDVAEPQKTGDVGRVRQQMSELARKNGYIMQIAVGLVVVLFVFCLGVVVYYRQTPKVAITLMGGNLLQLVLLAGWLRRLWIEKTTLETLLIATEELPPAEASKLLLAFYFKALKAK